MRLNPYLTFDGQREEAFRFYEKCLGGNLVLKMTELAATTQGQTRERL
jgi:PhnB protein